MSVLTLTGGQYGSEGKGVIAAKLAMRTDVAVRTGGPNAGHSIIHEGRVWKMRSIPCAWINPATTLIIGAGAVIDPATLMEEVNELEAAGYNIRNRLHIDPAATIVDESDRLTEKSVYNLGEKIGSTLEGVGNARIRRIQRNPHPDRWVEVEDALSGHQLMVHDTTELLNLLVAAQKRVVLEGTQGFGLSLNFGHWPYVTSANCHSAQLVADAGIGPGPGVNIHNLTVFRAYPIRVGGNSGPLQGETTWDAMAARLGKPGLVERTTVTKKIRRIGTFDWELANRAVIINNPYALALTFADYIDPEVEGMTIWTDLTKPVRAFIAEMEERLGVPVAYVGTGGSEWSVVSRTPDQVSDSRDTGKRENNGRVLLS